MRGRIGITGEARARPWPWDVELAFSAQQALGGGSALYGEQARRRARLARAVTAPAPDLLLPGSALEALHQAARAWCRAAEAPGQPGLAGCEAALRVAIEGWLCGPRIAGCAHDVARDGQEP